MFPSTVLGYYCSKVGRYYHPHGGFQGMKELRCHQVWNMYIGKIIYLNQILEHRFAFMEFLSLSIVRSILVKAILVNFILRAN